MIAPLRRRLTALFAGATCLVLGAALLATFCLALRQEQSQRRLARRQSVQAVTDALTQYGAVSDQALAKWEAEGRMILSITDNGAPLYFRGAWQPPSSRQALVEKALALAGERGVCAEAPGRAWDLALTGPAGDAYSADVVYLWAGRQVYGVVALHSRQEEWAALRALALRHLALFCLGGLALAGLSRLVVGRALRPTAEALRRQNEFIAAASHELRSPLAVIRASLAAARTEADGAHGEKFLAAADAEAARMGRLVDDLLVLAASDAGTWRVHPEPVALDGLCIDVFDRWLPLCRQTGHRLALHLPEGLAPVVRADRERLIQLAGILLSNACDYTPPGTDIAIALKGGRRWAFLAVIDHGPGVPDGQKAQIFRRFVRADAARTGSAHFGLGLPVAAELARMHGGSLTCGDTPGGGATFTLRLPLYH